VPALEARANYNPIQTDVAWPDALDAGQRMSPWCDNGDACVRGDQAVYIIENISTSYPPQMLLDIDWARTVVTEDDVPWCVLQITCHGAVGTITDVEEWGACSGANAMAKNQVSAEQCDRADSIMIMVGVNRGGFD